MHLAVFWLGTGNHAAGWRMEGAWDNSCSWPMLEAGARIAERGKFDLFFISDSLACSLNDHPSFQTRFEPTTAVAALSIATRHVGLGIDELQRPLYGRAHVSDLAALEPGACRLERGDEQLRRWRAQLWHGAQF